MTKAEKEKAKKAQARLDAMKAAGMLPTAISAGGATPAAAAAPASASGGAAMYAKKKPAKKAGEGSEKDANGTSNKVGLIPLILICVGVNTMSDLMSALLYIYIILFAAHFLFCYLR
jgi:hypothetical protein